MQVKRPPKMFHGASPVNSRTQNTMRTFIIVKYFVKNMCKNICVFRIFFVPLRKISLL